MAQPVRFKDDTMWSDHSSEEVEVNDDTSSLSSCDANEDSFDDVIDFEPLNHEDIFLIRQKMCSAFMDHIWKESHFLVSSRYKLAPYLDLFVERTQDVRDENLVIINGPWSNKYGAVPSNIKRHKKRKHRTRREKRETKRRRRLQKIIANRRKLQGKGRRLPRKTKRMICRYKQCLFRSANVGSAGGVTASCLSVIIVSDSRIASEEILHAIESYPCQQKYSSNRLADQRAHGQKQGVQILFYRRKHVRKNGQCIYRYVGCRTGDRKSTDLDDGGKSDGTDSQNIGRVVRCAIEKSGLEATGNTGDQKTSTENDHSETLNPGQLHCEPADIATPSAVSEEADLRVDRGNILNEKQDGNAGCVSSSVEGAGQSPDGECVECVDSEESAENDADILQGSEESGDTNAIKNEDRQNQQSKREIAEDVSTCAKESKEHNVRSAAEATKLATGGLTATCKKFNKMNKIRQGSEILHSLVSADDMRGAIECLEQKVGQPLQTETSIVSYKKKPQDEEEKDEVSQLYSVNKVPPSSQEGIVAMVRIQRLSSPHTQRLTTVHNGFNREIMRLATFFQSNTPDRIFVIPIAKTGFFLTSSLDDRGSSDAKVECAFCAVTVDILLFLSRNAEEVHREVSPRCPFLLGENVGNESIAEIAEQAGAKFLDKYPLTVGCTTGASATTRSPHTTTSPLRRDHLAEVLATDSEPTAAEEPASYSPSLPTVKPGSAFSSQPADIRSSQPFGNDDSSRLRDTAGPQLQRDGAQGSGSRDVGETVADSRPALAAGTGGSHLAASASATAPCAGRTEMPYQTATFSTPEPQPSSTGTATPSQTTTANQPASNQTNGPHQTATANQPASNQTNGPHQTATANQPASNQTNGPHQTATANQPASNQTNGPHQTATANQPASNQTNGPHQTATVSAGPVTSGGTAREAPQSTAPGSEGDDRSQTSGNGGGTDSIGRSENGTERQLVTYEELGIFSQRPKRPDMAVKQVRINTFEGWPHQGSHPKEEMAEAGFYYTGHADLVRCFHCKGGLKTWESSDQPWIEHSRWFPRCPFIKLCKGQKFVLAVQKLNDPDTRPTITESDVLVEIRRMEDEERSSLRDDVVLLENLPNPNAPADPVDAVLARTGLRVDADVTEASMQEVAERLVEENEELTSSTLCKMCQTNEVNVLFLPCGHLVSCAQCAPALRTCAMCRQPVRGSVRVLLDEKRESEEASQQPPGGAAASTH